MKGPSGGSPEFLGINPAPEQWPAILEYTGFPWMKAHESKFEASRAVMAVPPLNSGAMIRKGQLGAARDDGMTDEIAAHLRAVGLAMCPDEAALDWLYRAAFRPDALSGN